MKDNCVKRVKVHSGINQARVKVHSKINQAREQGIFVQVKRSHAVV